MHTRQLLASAVVLLTIALLRTVARLARAPRTPRRPYYVTGRGR